MLQMHPQMQWMSSDMKWIKKQENYMTRHKQTAAAPI